MPEMEMCEQCHIDVDELVVCPVCGDEMCQDCTDACVTAHSLDEDEEAAEAEAEDEAEAKAVAEAEDGAEDEEEEDDDDEDDTDTDTDE